jgi:hypothetical protein
MGYLDRAKYVDIMLRKKLNVTLAESIVEMLDSRYHSLIHSFLASLPCNEFVTTNYDTLFEEACRMRSRKISVLPYDTIAQKGSQAKDQRWILKM